MNHYFPKNLWSSNRSCSFCKKNFNNELSQKLQNHETERISIYNNKVMYLRDAIKYMVYANGGAITGVLIKFDINKFYLPLAVFSFGVAYSLMIPIFMYFNTKYLLQDSIQNNSSPLSYGKRHPTIDKILRFIIFLIVYFPMLCFCYGIYLAISIFLFMPLETPTGIIEQLIKVLINMVLTE